MNKVAAFGSTKRTANAANAGSRLVMPAALKQRDLESFYRSPSLQPAWAQRPKGSAMRHR